MQQVIEVIERCAENTCVSRPFKVRAEDGHLYFIKGCGPGWTRRELCHELLAARLAEAVGLPVAPFAMLDVSPTILEFCTVPGVEDLRAGPAFGSQKVDASSLPPVAVKSVPEELRWKLLLFDWWIQNEDRILGEMGGNVNLLWSPEGRLLTVIDHNNAFDAGFNEAAFFEGHVFRAERDKVPAPYLLEQSQAFGKAAARFAELTGDLPDEWVEHHGSTGDFKPESAIEILGRSAKLLDVFGVKGHE
ncbi:MAG TPA: hypothetical protein PLG22_13000 [Kiritimatiellia bacterium]|nr:hypothetical protein [Kiritimatiellia bacterium]